MMAFRLVQRSSRELRRMEARKCKGFPPPACFRQALPPIKKEAPKC